jgi:hypothetical protein
MVLEGAPQTTYTVIKDDVKVVPPLAVALI